MKEYMKEVLGRIWKDILDYKWPLLLFGIYYVVIKKIFRAFCPLVIVTGFPCPACGMTRALLYLFTGQFERSFNIHPMGALFVLLAVYCIVMRYFLGKRVLGLKYIVAVLMSALIVFYLYRMATIFPNRPPMSYTRNNLLLKIFHILQESYMQ